MAKLEPRIIKIPYRPRFPQDQVHKEIESHRFSVFVGHRRLGKSVMFINHTLKKAAQNTIRSPRYAFIAPFLKQAKMIAWDYLKRYAMPIPGTKTNESELSVMLPNGAKISLFGADNPEAMRGTYFDGVVLDEYGQFKKGVFTEIIRPTLVDRKGWAIFGGTPKGMNEFFEIREQALKAVAAGNTEWWTGLYRADETAVIDENELAQLKATLSDRIYRQEFLCVPPGEKIFTSNGQKPIENIQVGDMVLSHSGRFRQVTKKFSRQHDGELISIQTYGDAKPLKVTANHPVRVLDKSKQKFSWVAAGNIRPGNLLVRPRRKVAHNIIVPSHLVEIIGWYLSEGSVSKTGVNIALGKSEKKELGMVVSAATCAGIKTHVANIGPVCQVTLLSSSLADFLTTNCGKLAHNKRIPWGIVSGHEKLLYKILSLGDGCRHRSNGSNFNVYVTVSEHLAYDFQLLSGTLGYRAGISRKAAGQQKIMGRIVQCKEKFEVKVALDSVKDSAKTFPSKHGVGVVVKSVETIAYSGAVHNIEVQTDHSYVVNGRTVHNCDFTAEADNVLIPIDLVSTACAKTVVEANLVGAPKILGVDVARFGDDRSVIVRRKGLGVYTPKIITKVDNMTLAGIVASEINSWEPDAVFIDAGRGEGVIDRLRQLGHKVTEVNFGGQPTNAGMHHNKRTEMWDMMREWLEHGGSLPNMPEIKSDLTTPTYDFDASNKMRLESKEDIKERLGRSPDIGDAIALTFAFKVGRNVKSVVASPKGGEFARPKQYDPYDET